MSAVGAFPDVERILGADRATGRQLSLVPSTDPESPFLRAIIGEGADQEVYQYVQAEIDHEAIESPYKLTIFERAKHTVGEHKGATAFTAIGVVSGVALAIVVLRHKQNQ